MPRGEGFAATRSIIPAMSDAVPASRSDRRVTGLGPPAARDWGFPRGTSGVAVLVRVAGDRGVDAGRVLAGSGLEPGDLSDPDREVTAEQELRVVRNLLAVTGDPPGGGLDVGCRYHLSTFGILGYAMLSSPTVLAAMDVALRYIDLSHTFTIPRPVPAGRLLRAELDDTGLPADVRRFLVERDLAAMLTVLGELTPGGVPVVEVELAFPAPADSSRWVTALGVAPRFAADRHGFAVDAAHLDRPLPQANPATLALCESLCADMARRRRDRADVAGRVRVLLTQQLAFGGGMEEVAAGLGMSVRTLRRRLAREGTGFRELLDEVRQELAGRLLATGVLGVEDVALRLGYAEATSFIHAFRRWTGRTPARWRAEREPGPSGPGGERQAMVRPPSTGSV